MHLRAQISFQIRAQSALASQPAGHSPKTQFESKMVFQNVTFHERSAAGHSLAHSPIVAIYSWY